MTHDNDDPGAPEDETSEDAAASDPTPQERQAGGPDAPAEEAPEERPARRRRRARSSAPKEKVLHTRVPAVLEDELKRLATNLRVPVSNVVRAILEDAVDAVDSVGERAEGELMGFVDRLARQRDELRSRVSGQPRGEAQREPRPEAPPREAAAAEGPECPETVPALLDGVYGYQPMVLAAETACSVCGRALAAGSDAHRALFDEPGKRIFLGPECRLIPDINRS